MRLIESHSTELAGLRALLEQFMAEARDGFQMVNWKLDRLAEIADNLNNREMISNRRLSKVEQDVSTIAREVAAIKVKIGA